MILVDLKDGQGLGNQLWLLAVGIYISNKKSRKLVIRNIQKFKADDLLTEKFFLYIELFSNYHLDIVWNVFNPLAFKYGFDENNIYFQEDKKFLDLFDMFEYIEIDGELRYVAGSFNQDLSSWDVSSVTECQAFCIFHNYCNNSTNDFTQYQWVLPKPNFSNCGDIGCN